MAMEWFQPQAYLNAINKLSVSSLRLCRLTIMIEFSNVYILPAAQVISLHDLLKLSVVLSPFKFFHSLSNTLLSLFTFPAIAKGLMASNAQRIPHAGNMKLDLGSKCQRRMQPKS